MLLRSNLYPYQEAGVEFIKTHSNCAAWIFMGGGKCATTATAFADMRNEALANKMLVIAPKRVARKVWGDEVQEWDHLRGLKVVPIVGDAKQCFAALKEPADIHTIGRGRMAWLHAQFVINDELIVEWPWDVVTVDESQTMKSAASSRFKALLDLRKKTHFRRMIELTGTPIPNGYMDLWSQVYLLDAGKRLGSNITAFRDRWFSPPVGIFTKWNIKPHAAREIEHAVRDIVYCLRESDYLTLPPVVDNFIRVELSAHALATYKKFEREYVADVAGKRLTAVNTGVLDGKLLQLANGACYTGIDREWVPFHDAKLEALEETLEATVGKALIAYSFNHDRTRISKVLDRRAKDSGRTWRRLLSDRDFQDWADGKIDWGILHPASAGHGLNDVYKAGCDDLIFFGLTNNWEWYAQVRARLTGGHRRAGRNIRVHHIVADKTRDDDYVRLIKAKEFTEDNLMASLATRIQ